jgi:hypothetical protein
MNIRKAPADFIRKATQAIDGEVSRPVVATAEMGYGTSRGLQRREGEPIPERYEADDYRILNRMFGLNVEPD